MDLSMIFIAGPGHGGPAIVANTYLEGTYSEVYPEISEDEHGSAVSISNNFLFQAASRATSLLRRRARFMKEESWAIHYLMPSALSLITPISLQLA